MNTVHVENPGAVREYLGEGDSLKVYVDFFKTQLPVSLKGVSTFKSLCFAGSETRVALHDTAFNALMKDSLTMMLPKMGSKVELGGQIPDIILFVQDLTTGTDEVFHYS